MKDVLRLFKKHWITVWLVVAVLAFLGTFISLSAYTEVSSVKRVVTTISAPKKLFSSNCMYEELYERRMPSNEYQVNVNNFDVNAPETPNSSMIQYTLTAELATKHNGTIKTYSQLCTELGDAATNALFSGATGYKIGKSQDNNLNGNTANPTMTEFTSANNYKVTFNGPTTLGNTSVNYETLPGGSTSTDKFKVEIPQAEFTRDDPEFYVYVKAVPVGDLSLSMIHTNLYGSKMVVNTAAWSGNLAESSTLTLDYDFYNYIITGSGSGKLDILWDPAWFEIDDFFFNSSLSGVTFDESCLDRENNVVAGTVSSGTYNGWKKVTIVVNSTGPSAKSRYEMQLYKVQPNTPYTGANNAANHIHCELQTNNSSNEGQGGT